MRRIIAAIAMLALVILPAAAQEKTIKKTVTVSAGQKTQISVIGWFRPDCRTTDFTVRIVGKARHGTVESEPVSMPISGFKRCPDLKANLVRIFYRPREDYIGKDAFAMELRAEDGDIQRRAIAVTVEK